MGWFEDQAGFGTAGGAEIQHAAGGSSYLDFATLQQLLSPYGGQVTPQSLAAIEPQLQSYGAYLQKDSSGNIRPRIYFSDGRTIDIEHNGSAVWVDRGIDPTIAGMFATGQIGGGGTTPTGSNQPVMNGQIFTQLQTPIPRPEGVGFFSPEMSAWREQDQQRRDLLAWMNNERVGLGDAGPGLQDVYPNRGAELAGQLGIENFQWGPGTVRYPSNPQPATSGASGAGSAYAQGLAGPSFAGEFGGALMPWTEQFRAPTAEEAIATPGFQAALDRGQQAIQRSAAAKGTLLTGGTLKDLNDWSVDTTMQHYGDIYGRSLGEYGLRRENFWANQDRPWNKLTGLAGFGSAGAGSGLNYASSAADLMTGAANANAAGQVGAANAWNQGLQGVTNQTNSAYWQWYYTNGPGARGGA